MAKEEAEIAILQDYLPQPLTEDELRALVDEGVAATGAIQCPRPRQGHGLALPADPRPRRRQGRSPGSSPRPSPAPTSPVTTRSTEPSQPGRQRPTTMLSTSAEPASTQFTRRDAGRLVAASAALALAMSRHPRARLPARRRSSSRSAKPAPANVVAPRTVEYTSDVLTRAGARSRAGRRRPAVRLHVAARRGRRRAAGPRARAQGRADRRRVRRRRQRRGPRRRSSRTCCRAGWAATIARRCWPSTRRAGRRSAPRRRGCSTRSSERSSATASSALTRDGVENRFAGELTEPRPRSARRSSAPLVVPNSSFSERSHRVRRGAAPRRPSRT